jgi:hypothetical protein
LSPAASEDGGVLVSFPGASALHYCEGCGRLIPPTPDKTPAPDAKHLCAKCTPTGRTAKTNLRSSKASLVPAQRVSPAAGQPRPSSASLRPASHAAPPRPIAPPPEARGSTQVLVFVGAGATVLIVGLIALALASSSPNEELKRPPPPKVAELPTTPPV